MIARAGVMDRLVLLDRLVLDVGNVAAVAVSDVVGHNLTTAVREVNIVGSLKRERHNLLYVCNL